MRALLGIASMVATVGLAGAVHAGPVEPLRPSDMLNLVPATVPVSCSSCGDTCLELNKQVNDAQAVTFTGIPSEQVLVVTGVEWTGGGSDVGVVLQFGSSPGQYTELARYPALATGGGAVQGAALFTIRPGTTKICVFPNAALTTAHLHGYLTADR